MKKIVAFAWVVMGLMFVGADVNAQGTMEKVHSRNKLVCGVQDDVPGFGLHDWNNETWQGFSADYCRAVAAAVLGDADKVEWVAVTPRNRFNAVTDGQADVVFARTPNALRYTTGKHVAFLPVDFYDTTGALVKTESGISHIDQLEGKVVCTVHRSLAQAQWQAWMQRHGMDQNSKLLAFRDLDGAYVALQQGRCEALGAGRGALAGWKHKMTTTDDLTLLPEQVGMLPLAGFVPAGDRQWQQVLSWVVHAVVKAEMEGITSHNVGDLAEDDHPAAQQWLKASQNHAKALGLPTDFVQKMIAQVGNFGEIYQRNLGVDSSNPMERMGSANALWRQGGLQLSPPWM